MAFLFSVLISTACYSALMLVSLSQPNGTELNQPTDMAGQFQNYCPYTDLCYSPALAPTEDIPCCAHCRCDDDCGRECCPDKPPRSLSDDEVQQIKHDVWECQLPQYLSPLDSACNSLHSFNMISRCPVFFEGDNEIRFRCERDYSDFDFKENIRYFMPYSDIDGNTFKNRYCSMCNNADDIQLIPWNVTLSCTQGRTAFIGAYEEIPYVLTKTRYCNVIFTPPLYFDVEKCAKIINRCNVTGNWNKYDKDLEKACLSYSSVYYYQYKNVHCAICNGVQNDEIHEVYTCNSPVSNLPFSYVALLDFNELEHSQVENHGNEVADLICLRTEYADKFLKRCRELHCPSGFVLAGEGQCNLLQIPQTEEQIKMSLGMTLMLYPTEMGKQILARGIEHTMNMFRFYIYTQVLLTYHSVTICEERSYIRLKQGIESAVLDMLAGISFENTIEYIALDLSLEANTSDVTLLVKDVAIVIDKLNFGHFVLLNKELDQEVFNERKETFANTGGALFEDLTATVDNLEIIDLLAQGFDDYSGNGKLPINLLTNGNCKTVIEITPTPFCARLKLPISKPDLVFALEHKVLAISFNDENVTFPSFILSKHDSDAYICRTVYEESMAKLTSYTNDSVQYKVEHKDVSKTDRVNVYLSVIFLAASIICLLVTFITYIRSSNLHNVPGFNNISLVSSLFVSSVLSLLFSFVTITPAWLCSLVGAVLHFSLLSGFFWMFICTFHMMRVFSSILTVSANRNSGTFFRYLAFAECMSGMLVGAVIVVSYTTTGDVGYGGEPCYIANAQMILYFVGIPVGVIVLANFTMFSYVVIKVCRLPNMSKSSNNERNNMKIFVKLSTITGCTWIFGFLYQFLNVDLFSYLFIIFNAGQGIFIMLSFVRKRHVPNKPQSDRKATSPHIRSNTENHGTNESVMSTLSSEQDVHF